MGQVLSALALAELALCGVPALWPGLRPRVDLWNRVEVVFVFQPMGSVVSINALTTLW